MANPFNGVSYAGGCQPNIHMAEKLEVNQVFERVGVKEKAVSHPRQREI